MLPSVLMTALTPLRNTNEIHCWENRPFTTTWPEDHREQHKNNAKIINIADLQRFQVTHYATGDSKSFDTNRALNFNRKAKRVRTAFTTEQLRTLEATFSRHKYIDSERRRKLADTLKVKDRCIKIWFQNRRMKEKKESAEMSSDTSSVKSASVSPPPKYVPQCDVVNQNNHHDKGSYASYRNHYPVYHWCQNTDSTDEYETIETSSSSIEQNDSFNTDNNIHPTQYYPNIPAPEYYQNLGNNAQYAYYLNTAYNNWSNYNCSPEMPYYHQEYTNL